VPLVAVRSAVRRSFNSAKIKPRQLFHPEPGGETVGKVTLFCFAASYATALVLEVLYQRRGGSLLRFLAIGFGAAGLLAHTIYLVVQRPPLAWQFGWMLFVAWILAIVYLYRAIHYPRLPWALFMLPLMIGLVGLAAAFGQPSDEFEAVPGLSLRDERFWGFLHAGLLLCATVGMCVGFLASLMYLFQARRLRAKVPSGQGMHFLSLERLEEMNRRAIVLTFPLLTLGVLLGIVLMTRVADSLAWTDPRVLSTGVLWLAFALLSQLRYGRYVRGRQVAFGTIAAFALLIGCLALSHPVGQRASQSNVTEGGR
jgi:ABC-type transport system involved in cytochrome c biogenesis permease subunit